MYDVIIVGGGASGLMSAIYASKNNKVLLIEKNKECGRKLLMTGNGRCNFYNENQDLNNYYSSTPDLIKRIINKDNTKEVLNIFHKLGITPKINNGYYYPFSNQAITIRNVLLDELLQNKNICIKYNTTVENISKKNNRFIVNCNDDITFKSDKLILATGSKAFPKTGSDGMGYQFLKKFNHHINDIYPALVQLKIDDPCKKNWIGIRSIVKIKNYENDILKGTEEGEIQLTDYGISGICVFNLSGLIVKGLHEGKKEKVKINFVPFIEKDVYNYLKELNYRDKTVGKLLEGILNYKLVNVILKKSKILRDKKFSNLNNQEISSLITNLSEFTLTITGANSFLESQTCGGGIPLTEINLNTMESRKVSGLYITGELIDLYGKCGGYNLTISWITGFLAGRSVNYDKN